MGSINSSGKLLGPLMSGELSTCEHCGQPLDQQQKLCPECGMNSAFDLSRFIDYHILRWYFFLLVLMLASAMSSLDLFVSSYILRPSAGRLWGINGLTYNFYRLGCASLCIICFAYHLAFFKSFLRSKRKDKLLSLLIMLSLSVLCMLFCNYTLRAYIFHQ
jgi:hypothetical protein